MLTDFLSVLGSRQARLPLNFIGTQWLTEAWASADVAEKQVKRIVETYCSLSRNLKHHHNPYLLSSPIQICMISALNCEWLYLFLLTGSYGANWEIYPWWAPVKI